MQRVISIYSGKVNQLRTQLKQSIRERLDNSPYKYMSYIPELLFAGLKEKVLGEYDVENDVILINSRLINHDYNILLNIALHELAHYITYRYSKSPHDEAFKSVCLDLGVDDDFEKARVNITKKEKLIDKINKLQALSESPFSEEGLSALLKISELSAKYDISVEESEESICRVVLYEARRIPNKIIFLGGIISVLTGATVIKDFTRGESGRLTAFGSYEELEVAEYLFDTLSYKIEKEIRRKRKEDPINNKGVAYVNGFYLGVLNAISAKQQKDSETNTTSKALVVKKNKNMELAKKLYYNQFQYIARKKATGARYNNFSYNQGNEYGKNLEIEKGIKDSKENLLLT